MRLTKKKAVDIAIELWEWLAETGATHKREWAGWKKYGEMWADCPLCEYDDRAGCPDDDACVHCPYQVMFGKSDEGNEACCYFGSPYHEWCAAQTEPDYKKYAGQFLEQLKSLKEVNK